MKALILFIVLALSPVHTPRSYTYVGSHVADLGDIRSCGASQRLLKEVWRVKIDKQRAWVNNVRWRILRDNLEEDGVTFLEYKVQEDAHMSMDFVMLGKSATVTLGGIDADRMPCLDMVHLKKVK